MRKAKVIKIFAIVLVLLAVSAISVFIGSSGFPSKHILFSFRLPRIFLGIVVGAGLGGAGAVMQGVLRNPLADPYILGTSAGAALGFILARILGVQYYSVLFFIFVVGGAFLATCVSYALARVRNKTPVVNLLLAGVLVNTFLGSLILLFYILHKETAFSSLIFMMGYITEGTAKVRIFSSFLVLIGAAISLMGARTLDILGMGEEKAAYLGINTEKAKLFLFFGCSLMTGGAVCAAGTVGFVGLIVPHILRLILGPLHRNLIIGSILGGAVFVVTMDVFSRTIIAPGEIPVGIFTALTGAPFFLWLLRRKKKEYTL